MPFASKSQQRFMYAKHPKMAEEFSKDMTKKDFKNLPERRKQAMEKVAKEK